MVSPKYVELFERLAAGTAKGEVKWDETASDETFITYFRGFSLSLARSFSFDLAGFIIIVTLRDESGNTVDSFATETANKQSDVINKLYSEVYEMYSSKRRKAREAEAVVDELLNQLKIAS